jgi:hypothetical protein
VATGGNECPLDAALNVTNVFVVALAVQPVDP